MYFAGHLDDEDMAEHGTGDGTGDGTGAGAMGVDMDGSSSGTVTFAGISLANMYANVTGFAFLNGMSTAVETVASLQNGAKRYEVSPE
jgi:Na+-driven multidrug efflux pump